MNKQDLMEYLRKREVKTIAIEDYNGDIITMLGGLDIADITIGGVLRIQINNK